MKTLCPRDDALETVLEVPIPEEMLSTNKSRFVVPQIEKGVPVNARNMDIQFLLGVIGAPLIPYPIRCDRTVNDNIKGHPIEISMAKYIVQQYIAASGGDHALNAIESMYAMGKVKMAAALDFESSQGFSPKNTKKLHEKNTKHTGLCEIGAFVLWQKRSDLWNLELMVSGCKISAGSDGNIAWRQTPWQSSHSSRGPPRPLRRLLQGLDPRSTANLFSNSICIGEKTVNNEDCFVLKLVSEQSALRSRSSSNVEIIKHTVWGCFSQRTGLLTQLKDSHLLRIKGISGNSVFWETTMESSMRDYRTINGVNIAHGGKTSVSLLKFEEDSSKSRTRMRMEEVWSVDEVDFNVKGLSVDCFLPPAELRYDTRLMTECNGKFRDFHKTKSGGLKVL